MKEKEELLKLLDKIASKQREISTCHTYYQLLEQAMEEKRKGNTHPEEMQGIMKEVSILNREFEEKTDVFYEDLNEVLIQGYDLAKKVGYEVGHDFKKLWDYMTTSIRQDVKLERVLSDIDYIKSQVNTHLH